MKHSTLCDNSNLVSLATIAVDVILSYAAAKQKKIKNNSFTRINFVKNLLTNNIRYVKGQLFHKRPLCRFVIHVVAVKVSKITVMVIPCFHNGIVDLHCYVAERGEG